MMTRTKAKKNRSFRWAKLLLLLVVALCVLRLGGQVKQYLQLNDEAEHYRQQLAVAEAEYQSQIEQIELLSSDAYIERVARARLGMVKQGECVVLTVDAELPTVAAVNDEIDASITD